MGSGTKKQIEKSKSKAKWAEKAKWPLIFAAMGLVACGIILWFTTRIGDVCDWWGYKRSVWKVQGIQQQRADDYRHAVQDEQRYQSQGR